MIKNIFETVMGLAILIALIYGLYLGGAWFIGLFDGFSSKTLALLSILIFMGPIIIGIVFSFLGLPPTAPMAIAIIMLPFSIIGLIISFIWFLFS